MKRMNKRFIILLAVFSFTLIFFIASPSRAFGFFSPFGGKVLSLVPGVVCPGGQAFIISGEAEWYATTAGTKLYGYKQILPTAWVLGLAGLVSVPICTTTSGAPVPAKPVVIIGTSLPSL